MTQGPKSLKMQDVLDESSNWHDICQGRFLVAQVRATKKHENSKPMNTLVLKGDWNIVKGKLKQKYAQLTDDHLRYAKGKYEELLGRIQRRTGKRWDEVEGASEGAADIDALGRSGSKRSNIQWQ